MQSAEFKSQMAELWSEIRQLEEYLRNEFDKEQQIKKLNEEVSKRNQIIPTLVVGQKFLGFEDTVEEADLIPEEYSIYNKPVDFDTKSKELEARKAELYDLEAKLRLELKEATIKNDKERVAELVKIGADPKSIWAIMKGSEFKELIRKQRSEIRQLERYLDNEANYKSADYAAKSKGLEAKVATFRALMGELQKELSTAIAQGNTGRMIELLEAGGNPNITTRKNHRTEYPLLIRAIKDENKELTEALLKNSRLKINLFVKLYDFAPRGDNEDLGFTALHLAVSKGDVGLVQKLMLHGADIHQQNSQGQTAQDLIPADKKQELDHIFAVYEAMEKDFKESFVPKMNEMIKGLKPDFSEAAIMDKLDEVLKSVYGTESSFRKSFAKNGTSKTELASAFKLGFIEEAIISIKAAFESILSKETYEQIKFGKMAGAIYDKVKDTPEFQELAAPTVRKAAYVVLDKTAQALAIDTDRITTEIVTLLGRTLFQTMNMTWVDMKAVADFTEQFSAAVVHAVTKERGIEVDEKTRDAIKTSINDQVNQVVIQTFNALDSGVNKAYKDFNMPEEKQTLADATVQYGSAFFKKAIENSNLMGDPEIAGAFKAIVNSAASQIVPAVVEQETGLKILGKHMAKVVQERGAGQGVGI